MEILGEKMQDEQAMINMLGGVKIKISENLILVLAYRQPVSTNKDFSSQYSFQPDIEFKRMNNMK